MHPTCIIYTCNLYQIHINGISMPKKKNLKQEFQINQKYSTVTDIVFMGECKRYFLFY